MHTLTIWRIYGPDARVLQDTCEGHLQTTLEHVREIEEIPIRMALMPIGMPCDAPDPDDD